MKYFREIPKLLENINGGKNNIYPVHSKREAMSKTHFNDASFVFGVVMLYFCFSPPSSFSAFSPQKPGFQRGERILF